MRLIALVACVLLCTSVWAEPPWRYLTREQEAKIRAGLPKTNDTRLQQILSSPDLIFYDETVMPGVFQDPHSMQSNPVYAGSNYSDSVRLVYTGRNISMEKKTEFAGSPNNEAPWAQTAGLPPGYPTVKALLLPPAGNIKFHRGIDGRPESKRVNDLAQWEYPKGTIFVEILYQKFSDGETMPFEIRTRVKSETGKGADKWTPNVFRPVRNEQELSDTLLTPRRDVKPEFFTLPSLHPTFFQPRKAWVVRLPRLPLKTAKYVLREEPFKSTIEETWLTKDGYDCAVATADVADSIVPKGYDGAFFATSKATCVNCHQDTQRNAYDIQNPRPWYGYVRGDDGIISMHFFANVQDAASGSNSLDSRVMNSGRVDQVK